VFDELPGRVREALGHFPAHHHGEASHGVVEADVSVRPTEESYQVLAKAFRCTHLSDLEAAA
jgi:hypothetical protein